MEKEKKITEESLSPEIEEPIEVLLFQVPECYVYLVIYFFSPFFFYFFTVSCKCRHGVVEI